MSKSSNSAPLEFYLQASRYHGTQVYSNLVWKGLTVFKIDVNILHSHHEDKIKPILLNQIILSCQPQGVDVYLIIERDASNGSTN